ncbi:glycoside hydrolase/deacetylase [Basidiobolus meristosporus CBS 931.73]|uniref:Glycoside hydrolase/deacetylase n=1 Tax=Basidiobolus meristosporus CBS 931.73 TaxID=1314790 RepID=A0A1Y1YDU9_9FUNG|nr:glycoside hydrolase/deacetylase [Basidiobolus meristosporus CBS 931.73]|eukprot:ORX96221.1 glycoside hydrolase/deacetylase [Basidiobolus meristosporus CBS 931.73]
MYAKSTFLVWEDGRCGYINGINVQCLPGHCCSKYGWCGVTEEHCMKSCNSQCKKRPNRLIRARQDIRQEEGVITNCKNQGTFAITFDDGPGPDTDKLLNLLRDSNIKVTFFVVGEMLESAEGVAVLKRAFGEGHHIASHTYHHIDLAKASPSKIREEMKRTSDMIYHVIGKRPRYMRPPYGSYNENTLQILGEMGYRVVYWNVDTLDWQHQDPKRSLNVYRETIRNSSPSDSFISLQHDIQESTIKAAKDIFELVKSHSFTITTVPDCLNDPNPYF